MLNSCKIWNTFNKDVFEKNKINNRLGYIIPGEEANTDLSTSVAFVTISNFENVYPPKYRQKYRFVIFKIGYFHF